ncbi:AP2/ERF domain-containing protein [Forsythia ovata]|uniref:AP2/ERF domain-containing protein n=1 Tax=Forsythia ovata TaxID=205694 RepID=A0ABD1RLP1_9LAMI
MRETKTGIDNNNNTNSKHPGYRGVGMWAWEKWVSEIREPRKKSWIVLGTFANPEMVARAHDVAVVAIKDSNAILNFLEISNLLSCPTLCSLQDVQAATVTKAAYMDHLHPNRLEDVLTEIEDAPAQEELSEIVELPSSEASYDAGGGYGTVNPNSQVAKEYVLPPLTKTLKASAEQNNNGQTCFIMHQMDLFLKPKNKEAQLFGPKET